MGHGCAAQWTPLRTDQRGHARGTKPGVAARDQDLWGLGRGSVAQAGVANTTRGHGHAMGGDGNGRTGGRVGQRGETSMGHRQRRIEVLGQATPSGQQTTQRTFFQDRVDESGTYEVGVPSTGP